MSPLLSMLSSIVCPVCGMLSLYLDSLLLIRVVHVPHTDCISCSDGILDFYILVHVIDREEASGTACVSNHHVPYSCCRSGILQ
jgi:hypothetical protein